MRGDQAGGIDLEVPQGIFGALAVAMALWMWRSAPNSRPQASSGAAWLAARIISARAVRWRV
jgi:hypothetical protein